MADIRLRWLLDVVDRGAGKDLLRQDRQIRRSLQQTDRQYKQTANVATSVAAKQAAASRRVESSTRGVARGSVAASREVRHYAEAQRAALAAGQRVISQSGRIESAYRRQGRAAREASVAERAATRAKSGAGSAAAAGAAGGRALRGGVGLAAGAGLGLGLAAATGDAVGFEKQMSAVQARLLTTKSVMGDLSNFALKLGATTQFSAREAAGAMDILATQGFSVREIYKTLPGTLNLAASAGTDLATAADVQTSAIRGFGLAASDAGRVTDVLSQAANKSAADITDFGVALPYVAATARKTGTSFEAVAAMLGILRNAGLDASTAGTAMRTSMLRLTDPSKKMVGVLGGIGLKASELAGIPLPRAIGSIAEKIKDLPRGRQLGVVSAVFGKEAAPTVLTLMAKGRKGIDQLTRSLEDSRGAGERSAKIMRDNVAGAWDNFTGSVEASSIKLTRRFLPAIKDALNAAAGGVNRAEGFISRNLPKVGSGLAAGLRGKPATTTELREGPGRRLARVRVEDPSKTAQVAQKVGVALRDAGRWAVSTGKQLVDAFKPAMPFFQNLLLPVIVGVGKGLIFSIGAALKVVIPAFKIWATVLGFVGKMMRPFRGLLEGVGQILAFVFGGAILKAIGTVGKLGGVFRLVGGAARVLAAPIRLVTAGFRLLGAGITRIPAALGRLGGLLTRAGGYFSRFPGRIAGFAGRVFAAAGRLVSAAGRALARLPARLAVNAYSAGRAVVNRLGGFVGRLAGVGGRMVSGLARPFLKLGSRIVGAVRGTLGDVTGFFGRVGKSIVGAIVNAIKSTPGAIKGAVSSLIPGPVKKVLEKAGGAAGKLKFWRRGGRARRYQGGGLVHGLASPGEMLVDPSGRTSVIPGPRVAADNTLISVPDGTAVLTDHGQGMWAQGWPLNSVIANQAPHFREGGLASINKIYPGHTRSNTRGKAQLSSLQVRAAAENAGYSPARAVQADQIARGESTRYPGVISSDGGHGLMQHTPRVWGAIAKRWMAALGGLSAMRNPIRNLKMAKKLSDDAVRHKKDMWSPWHGTRYLDRSIGKGRVRSVLGSDRLTGSSTARVRLPDKLTFAGSLPSRSAAFEAGRSGLPLGESISDIVTGAAAQLERRYKDVSGAAGKGASGGGRGRLTPGGGWAGTKNLVMGAIRGLGQRRTFKRSRAVNGNQNSDHNTWIKNAFASDLSPGSDSIFTTIARRLGIAARKGSWNVFNNKPVKGFRSQLLWHAPDGSHKDHVHLGIRALRRGGILGGGLRRFQGGGTVRGSVRGLLALPTKASRGRVGQALTGFADLIEQVDDVTAGILRQRLADVRAQARRLLAGGLTKRERLGYRRLVAESRDIRRDLVQEGRPASFARLTQIDRNLATRIRGVQKGGVHGIRERVELRRLKAAQRVVQTEMSRRNDLVIRGVERQGAVLERARAGLSRLLRVRGVDEASAAGLAALQKLGREQMNVLQRDKSALERALTRARRLGDRTAVTTISDALDEMRETIAESATTLIEQARAQAAAAVQERVDVSAHRLNLAQLGLARLETEQRIKGTFDTGARARADYINQTVIPAIRRDIAEHDKQLTEAIRAGDKALMRQLAETIASEGNDLAQAQLDAMEQVAENTDPENAFGGTLGFEAFGERRTDKLLGALVGT